MKQTSAFGQTNILGILPMFLHWYFVERPLEIVRAYGNYAGAFSESFSFVYMLKTFFAPWKSIKDDYPKKGFNVEMILETLTLNVTARVIGMIFRLFAMLTGLVIQAALLVLFAAYLVAWIAYPMAVIAVIAYLFRYLG